VVTKDEYETIARRINIFRNNTVSNERIITSLITANGLQESQYSRIFDIVVYLDDLFR
jgi:hypothetical protein